MAEHPRDIARRAVALVRPQFRLAWRHGIHGLPHWVRVSLHGRALAAAMDVDPSVPTWFAFLHDSQRLSDGSDPQHGARAADFALRLRRAGEMPGLDAGAFELLCEAMRLHSDGHTAGHAALQVCWDADRLDLGRVGIRPHPARLCTPPARLAPSIARALRMSTGLRSVDDLTSMATNAVGRLTT